MTTSFGPNALDSPQDPILLARQAMAGAKEAITRTNRALFRLSAVYKTRPDLALMPSALPQADGVWQPRRLT